MRILKILMSLGMVAAIAAPSQAADSRWRELKRTPIPLYYYQGTTHDEQGNRYFTGVWFGLYRTDSNLEETGRNDDVIPPQMHVDEGYDHVGDLSYANGNLYLPLECYYGPVGNTCNTGSIGVADPETLEIKFYVKLDPNEIEKAMWCEVSPNGKLLWTQSGEDLLAYRMSDIVEANAAPEANPIQAVRRIAGAVPPTGITGATFIGKRLYVAGQDGVEQIWSLKLADGSRRLEVSTDYIGESEGLDDDFDLRAGRDGLEGSLHWMVQPYNEENYPTNGITNGVIYNYERSARKS